MKHLGRAFSRAAGEHARKANKRRKRRGPGEVDLIVGRNLRIARLFAGYSQTKLAEAVGITFQQIQKYERGANRLSIHAPCRLLRLSASA
jgi:DNA-binding XRE family transcriptional regulator